MWRSHQINARVPMMSESGEQFDFFLNNGQDYNSPTEVREFMMATKALTERQWEPQDGANYPVRSLAEIDLGASVVGGDGGSIESGFLSVGPIERECIPVDSPRCGPRQDRRPGWERTCREHPTTHLDADDFRPRDPRFDTDQPHDDESRFRPEL